VWQKSYFVTFGRGMSAAVYMLFLILFMTANLMPQALYNKKNNKKIKKKLNKPLLAAV